jgi:hypothetical protein
MKIFAKIRQFLDFLELLRLSRIENLCVKL